MLALAASANIKKYRNVSFCCHTAQGAKVSTTYLLLKLFSPQQLQFKYVIY
jgi:hypothetical protein